MEMKNSRKMFQNFPGYDRHRFPEKIERVTAGAGGEALLLLGSEKTALLDCGMAYCADQLIENIKNILHRKHRTLDVILLSHTHYDHIGALPYVLKEWPNAQVFGAAHCQRVFASEGARRKIQELGQVAWSKYRQDLPSEILVEGMKIDRILRDYDQVSLGEEWVVAIETKGHTDCSMTYVLQPDGVMFASESTGVLESPDFMHVSILKSYQESMASAEKCRDYPISHLVSPHYGSIPDFFIPEYWRLFVASAEMKRDYLFELHLNNLSFEEMLATYTKKYWNETRGAEQPKEAFLENAKNIIAAIIKEF